MKTAASGVKSWKITGVLIPMFLIAELCCNGDAQTPTQQLPPVPSVEQTIPVVSMKPTGPLGTYWSMQDTNMAPLPFNPFPALRVYPLGGDAYLIDDRAVDYPALQAQRTAAMAAATGPSGPAPRGGTRGPGELGADSVTISNGFLDISIGGLVPGANYFICSKTVLDDDFTNYWVPEWAFVPSSSNQTVAILLLTGAATSFYRFVDYDLYQGPSLSINSPADNSTISGTIHLAASLTDIFEPRWAELYIDGNFFKKVDSGPLGFDVDTAQLSNGSHIFTLVLTSLVPADTNGDYMDVQSSVSLANLTTSNWFAADNIPQAFTESLGAVPFEFETTTPSICKLEIKDSNGAEVRTFYVTNQSAGQFLAAWDLTKNDGSLVGVPASFDVTATAFPIFDFPTNGVPIHFPTSIHRALHAGYTATFRAKLDSSVQGYDSNQQSLLDSIASDITWSSRVHYADRDGYVRTMNPNSPTVFYQDSDLQNFFTITTNINTGHVIWVGHGSPADFGAGDNTLITKTIGEQQIRLAYGNTYNVVDGTYTFGAGGKKGRIRCAELDGCETGNGDLCWAFGTPKIDLDADINMEKSAYCGWSTLITGGGAWPLPDTPYDKHVRSLQGFWSANGLDLVGIKNASHQAFVYYGDESIEPRFIIIGSQGLTWQLQ